jgi:PIN domain
VAYFICLDTSVLFDLVQELETGKPPEWWSELKSLIEAGDVTLIVPEITLLELETCVRDFGAKLLLATVKPELDAKASKLLQDQQRLAKLMNDHLAVSLDHLAKSLNEWRHKRIDGWKTEAEALEKWLREHGVVIDYTAEIAHRAKRRLIAGRLPWSEEGRRRRDQDCAIIDSLVVFFDNKLHDRILVFGTFDKKDGGFGQVEDGNGSLDKKKFEKGVGILDKTFAEGLPLAQLFDDMEKLVKFIANEDKPKTLSPEEQAVAQELKLQQEATAEVVKPGGKVFEIRVGDTVGAHDQATTVSISGSGGITFGGAVPGFGDGMPSTKTAHVRPNENDKALTQDEQYKRWTDPNGVSWRLVFYNHAPPMMGDPSLSLTIVLDRASAQYSTGDVSEKCAQYLRTLTFKPG